MFIVRSKSAAHAFIDIVRCTVGNPHLADVIESAVPTLAGDAGGLDRHIDRILAASEIIGAATPAEASKAMPVAIDVHDPAVRSALAAMIALYVQFLEIDDAAEYCADALDIAEIRMTIQADMDYEELLQA
jgi:hypothetical protein